ncbi:MAG: hypothetical protein GY754_26040 [bacterium]|nr:hypothetical protein [bacterium]
MNSQETSFKFSPRLLEHLGISAYNSVQKCLSELCANAYDADAKEVKISLPDIIDNNAVIEVEDKGVGMSPEEISEKFLFIGRNRRAEGERTPCGRLIIGSKGIGKLAGFGIASRILIVSWKDNVQSTVKIDRNTLDDLTALSNQKLVINTNPSEHPNGTRIQLLKLHEDLHLPNKDVVRRNLFKSLPSSTDFRVLVNDIECSAEDIIGERQGFHENIPGNGEVSGFYIIANTKQKQPGLAVRVRGRIVQEPGMFGLDAQSHGFFTAQKIIGEINAEFLDPEKENDSIRDLINTTRDGFLKDSLTVQHFDEWAQNFLKKIIQGVDESETKKRTDALLKTPAIKERLDKLPAHIRGTATSVVRSIIVKLKTASDEDTGDLIEWVLRYYESNILRELVNAILSADIEETEKLSSLIQEWGLNQVNNVVGIIRTQIDIIIKLEELISSDKSKEIDLHKLIENNLWLVREGLELWSSDKPLKTVLETQVDQIYKDRQEIRPDLICKSRNQGNEAIIIEFKRPTEKVVMDHVTQALEYHALIKEHRPNMKFETFVVGRNYHSSVLAARENLESASLHLWSFEEILQKSRMRFEKILEILGR